MGGGGGCDENACMHTCIHAHMHEGMHACRHGCMQVVRRMDAGGGATCKYMNVHEYHNTCTIHAEEVGLSMVA